MLMDTSVTLRVSQTNHPLEESKMSEANKDQSQLSEQQLENVSGGVDFDQLRRENLDKDAVDFDQLRRENLDKDAVSDDQLEGVAGGVNFDQLRRENLDKDAVDTDQLRRENLDKD
ncbi:MAG: hypothetical protein AAGH78_04045 [Cyanobacteria bacterium P01_H01_bin.58]